MNNIKKELKLEIINPSPKDAIELQKELANKVTRENEFEKINYVAGVDISNEIFKSDKSLYAAVVVFSFPELKIVEKSSYSQITNFPYIPGLLAFRESPPIIKAIDKLKIKPDIIIVDGTVLHIPENLALQAI